MIDQSTICAISTAPGTGGIAVIRLSGRDSFPLADKIYQSPASGKTLLAQAANTLHFGAVYNGTTLVDEVVVSLFRAPHSFTGEDVVEISCHGSTYIQQQIFLFLISKGARMALPGEFTQRAFLNGKMDLSQAEAVADLIASGNAASHRLAMNQMRGGFSQEINQLRAQPLHFTTLVELELDFSEEDVEFADRSALVSLALRVEALLARLISSFRLGNAIKNGIPVAIVGETNVGKSTLLNALLNEEKAIVSDIHGTTRDIIEDVVNIDGVVFRFFDTAGIRETTDVIENMGIERSYRKLERADIVLLVVDMAYSVAQIKKRFEEIEKKIEGQKLIVVGNKSDIGKSETVAQCHSYFAGKEIDFILISAKSKHNMEELLASMAKAADLSKLNQNDVIVTNLRHYEALHSAHRAVVRVIDGLHTGITGDFLAQDIRECLHYLGSITGQISTDEVLGNIFRNFCIGK